MIERIKTIAEKNIDNMYLNDFFLTWEKTDDELAAVFEVAQILRGMRDNNISPKVFDSGLAVSLFRDNSTRTRFSFSSACNLLGLTVQDLDEGKSQIAHGETVRETANMVSFLGDVIGIRDDMYLGAGNAYMKEVAKSVQQGYEEKVLPQRPTLVNLQCDIDHPTQTMSDALHLINTFGGLDKLRGKKIAMTWAYSPSYGKPLSVPQGIIGLMTRFGMDVSFAYPEGYNVMDEVVDVAKKNAEQSGGKFEIAGSMEEAFEGADIVYPKSWAPYAVMEQRTGLLRAGDDKGLKDLEKQCLENNKKFVSWECTRDLMNTTRNKNALYMHCLPADITGVSCKQGEVAADVFDQYRVPQYIQAGYKPYVIAAMIFLSKFKHPGDKLMEVVNRGTKRIF
ncbi:MAG: knotted carbamoyltransferase YgeW [Proteobacteria bacterium]|nr:knotted carbamoyltransferase YgeW [Pseudomonadota bacterium]MBU1582450.1 knotted carbamoyltransferase YgeW [Pseudomonadota bacterium]